MSSYTQRHEDVAKFILNQSGQGRSSTQLYNDPQLPAGGHGVFPDVLEILRFHHIITIHANFNISRGPNAPGFKSLKRLLNQGNIWRFENVLFWIAVSAIGSLVAGGILYLLTRGKGGS